MAKFLKLLIGLPIAAVILGFALANRQDVSVSVDPFSGEAALTSPLYILLFLTLLAGVVVGGIATWFTQGRARRRARLAEDAADRWRAEAERARAMPQALVPAPATGRGLVRSDYA